MLNVDIKPVKGILFVRLSGNLDKKTLDKLDSDLFSFLEDVGIKNIVFNVSELDYIDKYGKNFILQVFVLCMKNKGEGFICVGDNKKILSSFKSFPDKIVKDELTALKLINC